MKEKLPAFLLYLLLSPLVSPGQPNHFPAHQPSYSARMEKETGQHDWTILEENFYFYDAQGRLVEHLQGNPAQKRTRYLYGSNGNIDHILKETYYGYWQLSEKVSRFYINGLLSEELEDHFENGTITQRYRSTYSRQLKTTQHWNGVKWENYSRGNGTCVAYWTEQYNYETDAYESSYAPETCAWEIRNSFGQVTHYGSSSHGNASTDDDYEWRNVFQFDPSGKILKYGLYTYDGDWESIADAERTYYYGDNYPVPTEMIFKDDCISPGTCLYSEKLVRVSVKDSSGGYAASYKVYESNDTEWDPAITWTETNSYYHLYAEYTPVRRAFILQPVVPSPASRRDQFVTEKKYDLLGRLTDSTHFISVQQSNAFSPCKWKKTIYKYEEQGFVITPLAQAAEYSFTVYPNPFKDHISVSDNSGNTGELIIRLISSDGTLVKEESTVNGELQMNTGSLDEGIYLVQITGPNKIFSQKLIKN